ncbi:gfo/Idh/MocA family oxidoreductase [Candidatus Poribacteria bacterium]|nr:MAG: gfo/Idh/MocA family oxidoreductase [Candidatus Poribacteria bacterium]
MSIPRRRYNFRAAKRRGGEGMKKVRVGLVGSGFVAEIHVEAFKRVAAAEVIAVASPTEEHVKSFAQRHNIPHWFTDYRKMLEMDELDMIVIGAPNYVHAQIAIDAANAGKHVVCEKPLCMNLKEADAMIEACRKAGVKLMYAEELCFAPKYVRLKQLMDEGAFGKVYHIKQSEKHDGPHSPWFWDVELSGGGVTMDMGCHAIQFFRWMLGGNPKPLSVYAEMDTYVHKDKTRGDDNSLVIINFETDWGVVTCLAEESWAKKGGMDDKAEVYGSDGVAYADLLRGISIVTYSEKGYSYAVEKASRTVGWSFTIYEEAWNYGFPQEMEHFVDCVLNDKEPLVTGEDGRAVLEIIFAAYQSAGTGQKVEFPFTTDAEKPIDLWKRS